MRPYTIVTGAEEDNVQIQAHKRDKTGKRDRFFDLMGNIMNHTL
jgi:hypothetical protein